MKLEGKVAELKMVKDKAANDVKAAKGEIAAIKAAKDEAEAEAAKQAVIDRIAAEHNAKKEAKRIAKGKAKRRDINSYVFDVKPYSIETDLESMALDFKKVTHGGIKAWGVEHVLIPVAFGIKKLRLQVICFGDDGEGNEFGEDDLIDIFNETHEDDIQSVDTHSFTKM